MADKTVTVSASALYAGLSIARLFVSDDEILPQITATWCERTADSLTIWATDRFSMCRYTLPAEGDWGGDSLLLRPLVAKMLRTLIADSVKSDDRVQLTKVGRTVRASLPYLTCLLPAYRKFDAFRADWLDAKTRTKVGAWFTLSEGAVGRVGLDPARVGVFAEVAKILGKPFPGATFTLSEPGKPVRVEIGDHFTGLIMPIRLDPKARS